jgi:hypothetical protein
MAIRLIWMPRTPTEGTSRVTSRFGGCLFSVSGLVVRAYRVSSVWAWLDGVSRPGFPVTIMENASMSSGLSHNPGEYASAGWRPPWDLLLGASSRIPAGSVRQAGPASLRKCFAVGHTLAMQRPDGNAHGGPSPTSDLAATPPDAFPVRRGGTWTHVPPDSASGFGVLWRQRYVQGARFPHDV